MKIEKFKKISESAYDNFDLIGLEDTYYQIWYVDKHGDPQELYFNEDSDVEPYDLESVVKYLVKLEDKGDDRLFIKKVASSKPFSFP
jgi:hypothetical protein